MVEAVEAIATVSERVVGGTSSWEGAEGETEGAPSPETSSSQIPSAFPFQVLECLSPPYLLPTKRLNFDGYESILVVMEVELQAASALLPTVTAIVATGSAATTQTAAAAAAAGIAKWINARPSGVGDAPNPTAETSARTASEHVHDGEVEHEVTFVRAYKRLADTYNYFE